jgi:hypothetical protein
MIEILRKNRVRGRIFENFGLGFLVNGLYGISDGSFEVYNLIDIIVSVIMILNGIYLQEKDNNE